MTYDVVVVGSGGGALVGAFLAQRAGLRTAVLERTDLVAGTSAYSGGSCWLPGSEVQQRAGLPDSTESARTYLAAILQNPDDAKIEAFLAEAPRLVKTLDEAADFAFEWSPFPEYFNAPGRVPMGRSIQPGNVKRDKLPPEVVALVRPPVERDRLGLGGRNTLSGGQALIARALDAFLGEGGTVLTGHRVTGYLVEGERVVGVTAETERGSVEVEARRGVIAAAGGFEGDANLRKQYGVPGSATTTMAPVGTNAGEPIQAGIELGAAIDQMDQGWFCPGLEQPDGAGSFTLGFRGGVMVDQTGHRYANECLPYDRFGREMAKADDRLPSFFVFDSCEGGRLPAIAMPEGELDAHLAAGTWIKADSLAEIAQRLGLAQLEATVARFNRFAESGVDEDFGRGEDEYDTFFAPGTGLNKALVPIDAPPFYAARFVLSDLGTKGGLVTDASGRVLRPDGSTIPGLYATSNSSASMFGPVYPGPGAPLGSAMVFASLAVQDILGVEEPFETRPSGAPQEPPRSGVTKPMEVEEPRRGVTKPLRVIQWTTGNIGRRSLASILNRPDLELVGVFAHGTDKVGLDAAELAGLDEPSGITATNDIEALIALEPDACVYNPLWSNTDELVRLLESGINVCTSAGWINGTKLDPAERQRVADACERGQSSIYGSGAHPGMTNLVALALTASCDGVNHVRITESVDCSTYESAETQGAMGFGKDPSTPGLAESVRRESAVFAESVAMMADAMGVTLDRIDFDVTFTAATGDSDLGFMRIPAGSVGSVYGYHRGWVGDRNLISVGFNWTMGDHVVPPKPLKHGHDIQVFGSPNMRTIIHCLPPSDWTEDGFMGLGMIYTAMPVTNAVPAVVAAPPGIITLADLPVVTARATP